MITELIVDTLASGGAVYGFILARRRFSKFRFKPDQLGTYPWLYMEHKGFYCPKCINIAKNKTQPQLCNCEEYHREHFHFECMGCGFKTKMRTADDKEK